MIVNWCENVGLKGLNIEYLECKGRTPLIYLEVDATNKEDTATCLFYGHWDKQPHGTGWHEGLGPTKPVIKDECLYGRGGADDGYSIFSLCTALKLIQDQNLPHQRCVFIMESCEESGSVDMKYWLETLKEKIGNNVKLITILDSGCGDYDSLWINTSLRGCTKFFVDI